MSIGDLKGECVKHLIVILCAVLLSGYTTFLAAEDKLNTTKVISDSELEQAEMNIIPLKPASTSKVQVGVIEPIVSIDNSAEQVLKAEADKATTHPIDTAKAEKSQAKVKSVLTEKTISAVELDSQSVSLNEVNADSAIPTDRIRAVISRQEQAWNSGDIDAYMQGYWKSDSLRFVSGRKFSYGWDSILASYKKNYPDSARMGKLTFNVKEIKMLSNYAALVVGRWQLERIKDKPSGVFTLLIERIDDKWVITHDHTSD